MAVIPVLDLRDGAAVRATGGDRRRYPALESVLGDASEPVSLAAACRAACAAPAVYVADLTALMGGPRDARLYRALAESGPCWLDAGVRSAADAREVAATGCVPVLGLETLPRPDTLAECLAEVRDAVFSLDLRGGVPLAGHGWPGDVQEIAEAAISARARRIVVLDLARVGGRGVGEPACPWRERWPGVGWIAGGGVRTRADVEALHAAGWAHVLVGTALHAGELGWS